MFKLYKKYLKKYKKHIIFGPMFKLVEAIFELLVPIIIANIIDNGLNSNMSVSDKTNFIIKNGCLLLLFAVIGLCSTIVCQFLASRASQGFGTELRNDLFKHINTLSFKELDQITASSLLTRMNSDINNVQVSIAMLIRLVVRAPFLVIGATVLSFMLSWKAGLIFLITGVLLFSLIFIIMFYTIPKNKKAQETLDNVTTITKENLSGNRVVRAFSRQKEEFKRFVDESVSLKSILVKVGKLNAILNPMVFIITNIAIVFVLYLGGFEFKLGNLNQGEVTSLYNYLIQIQIAIMVVANLVVIFTKASASSARINEVFNLKSSIISGDYNEKLNDIPFEFKNVCFTYNDNADYALSEVSFKIENNMTVGIIGGTGSGKTTIVNLMNRFYDSTKGEILFYGRDIKDYTLDFVNSNIATVMQKAILFNGTVTENIKWGNKAATDLDLEKALRLSMSYDFVSKMEEKENTKIMQGGTNLSGGQRQRLSIARALVKNADILILDDSSSALDYKTDLELRKNLKTLNKTTILISQRASTIMHADMIICMDQGMITGIGTHDELLNTCPVYLEICDSQDVKEGHYE